jgi:hypothetical protein
MLRKRSWIIIRPLPIKLSDTEPFFAAWFGWCAVVGLLLFQHTRSIGREEKHRYTSWSCDIKSLTDGWSQPLASMKSTFDFMKQFLMFAMLATIYPRRGPAVAQLRTRCECTR